MLRHSRPTLVLFCDSGILGPVAGVMVTMQNDQKMHTRKDSMIDRHLLTFLGWQRSRAHLTE